MGVWFLMFGCAFVFPVIMLVAGWSFLRGLPKEINWVVGYRTARSMKNEETWRFAHSVAGRFYWKWGWIALPVAVVPMLFVLGQPEEVIAIVGLIIMCVLMIPIFAVIPYTEIALRNTFDKDGNRKVSVGSEGPGRRFLRSWLPRCMRSMYR